ncbi:putative secreted protein [Propionispora sp. 2/2-37]|uniref:hypothetical protein n=1 Tax=Propionispora sp. 2/2-37 TaxID=1677858 RepID=UPI0006BB61D3|nr:hypothetical protein [Propionispora sp. 2/2-37]CUH94511.1 putative secreted protein [Propionispora sp. 2/2-37]
MKKQKHLAACTAGILLAVAAYLPAFAADNQEQDKTSADTKENKKAEQKAPIVIDADQLKYVDSTGDFLAQGNVNVTQLESKLLANEVQGNSQQFKVWVQDNALFMQPGLYMEGHALDYNYQDHTGHIEEAKGKIGDEHVYGNQIELDPEMNVIRNGYMTRCPAKVPDYRMSAERIEIWPGDHYIAYNAKFWIKNTVIYSMPTYRGSLKKGEGGMEFPKIGYDSDGITLKQHLEAPIGNDNKLLAFADLRYYSNEGFRPLYGFRDVEEDYEIKLQQGYLKDDDDSWIKVKPELSFNTARKRLGSSPFSYTYGASYGQWEDSRKSSWRQDYHVYFSRDPIKLSDSTTLNFGTGISYIKESYDDSTWTPFRFDVRVNKKVSDRFSTWVGYSYNHDYDTTFSYNQPNSEQELRTGFNYKIDRLNAIAYNYTYEIDGHRVKDVDYTWTHNLHCWDAHITYRAKRDQIKFEIDMAHF